MTGNFSNFSSQRLSLLQNPCLYALSLFFNLNLFGAKVKRDFRQTEAAKPGNLRRFFQGKLKARIRRCLTPRALPPARSDSAGLFGPRKTPEVGRKCARGRAGERPWKKNCADSLNKKSHEYPICMIWELTFSVCRNIMDATC